MVKRKKYFLNPISCQNFANAFAETPNLNLEVRLMLIIHFSKRHLHCLAIPFVLSHPVPGPLFVMLLVLVLPQPISGPEKLYQFSVLFFSVLSQSVS